MAIGNLGPEKRTKPRIEYVMWDEIADDIAGHDWESCKNEFIRVRAEEAIARANKRLTAIETTCISRSELIFLDLHICKSILVFSTIRVLL